MFYRLLDVPDDVYRWPMNGRLRSPNLRTDRSLQVFFERRSHALFERLRHAVRDLELTLTDEGGGMRRAVVRLTTLDFRVLSESVSPCPRLAMVQALSASRRQVEARIGRVKAERRRRWMGGAAALALSSACSASGSAISTGPVDLDQQHVIPAHLAGGEPDATQISSSQAAPWRPSPPPATPSP